MAKLILCYFMPWPFISYTVNLFTVPWRNQGQYLWYFGKQHLFLSTCGFKFIRSPMIGGVSQLLYVPIKNFPHQTCKSWWRHQMETFSALLAICAGNSPVSGEFSVQTPVTRSFDVSFICTRINGWVNNVRLVIWDAIVSIMTSP